MNVFEIVTLLTIVASAANLVVFKFDKLRIRLPAVSVVLGGVTLLVVGYRIHMVPAYLLAILLLLVDVLPLFLTPRKTNRLIKISTTVLLGLTIIIAIAFPVLFPVVHLPGPNGSYSVGTTYLSFTDESRKGLFTKEDESREIGVQIWYPTEDTKNRKVANFFVDRKLSTYMADRLGIPNLFDHLALVRTHSYTNAKLSNREHRYPIVLFSSGYGSFVGQNTVQMEALASRGYIVFSIAHPYEDFASIYPDGNIVRFNTQQLNQFQKELNSVSKSYTGDKSGAAFEEYAIKNSKIASRSVHIWSRDTSFVADEIEKLNHGKLKSMFMNKLDTSNMGVFGHSFGGATAGQVCIEDSRFKAFINMDGTAFGDARQQVIKQPFMIMNGDSDKNLIKAGYSPKQTNFIDVTINGAKHADFMDFTIVLPSFQYLGMLGTIGGSKQENIMNDYVVAFFNKHLKGLAEPLIDAGFQKYDQVTTEHR